jgi:ATP-dependent Lon protease
VIDEIDKVGHNSLKGDVSSTLLELLNPEQSNTFRDNYLDVEFDFSECIFICTSNSVTNMLGPLLDRIEIIQVPAYLPIEKINIAEKYLVPRLETEYGFNREVFEEIKITEAAMVHIINHYCAHEAGVRNLRKCLDKIFRKVVKLIEDKKLLEEPTNPVHEIEETSKQ